MASDGNDELEYQEQVIHGKTRRVVQPYQDPALGMEKAATRIQICPNYDKWKKSSLWELIEAVFLVHDYQPLAPDVPRDEEGDPISHEKANLGLTQPMKTTYKLAQRSIKAGDLQVEDDLYVIPGHFISWALSKGIGVPEEFIDLATPLSPPQAVSDDKQEISGKERQELGRLRQEKEKWDNSILAAVHLTLFCIKQDRELTREELFDELSGHFNIPDTTFEKIRKALPSEYLKSSGRPHKKG